MTSVQLRTSGQKAQGRFGSNSDPVFGLGRAFNTLVGTLSPKKGGLDDVFSPEKSQKAHTREHTSSKENAQCCILCTDGTGGAPTSKQKQVSNITVPTQFYLQYQLTYNYLFGRKLKRSAEK